MIIAENIDQGSDQWHALRKGRITASEASKILTATGKPSSQAIGYMRKLARECVADDPHEWTGNKHTDWGNAMEPEARDWLATTLPAGQEVVQVGFIQRADGAPVGCSPDGLIRDTHAGEWLGGLEIKCPQVDTHVGYVLDGKLPDAYRLQVHASLAVTGLPYWWFVSYFPGLRPLCIRVDRDDFTDTVSRALDQFVIRYAAERERVLTAILPAKREQEMETVI